MLGITGGIAAYKACEVLRLLVRDGHDVLPLPTRGATRFVTAETFDALARQGPHRPVPASATGRPDRHRAADGAHAGTARSRARRRRPDGSGARASRPPADRACHEHRHVGASRHAGEPRDAPRPRRLDRRSRGWGARGRRGRHGQARRASGHRRPRAGASSPSSGTAGRMRRRRHGGRHPGAARHGALPGEPLVRPHGGRPRNRGPAAEERM